MILSQLVHEPQTLDPVLNMLARWFVDVNFDDFFVANNCDFRNGCGHFWYPELTCGRAVASIVTGPFWHLGDALGGHESSRKNTWGSESDFH